jgi:hypothetical protein
MHHIREILNLISEESGRFRVEYIADCILGDKMAEFIIDIDDRDLPRVRAAIARNFNRKDRVPNPSFDPGFPENSENNPGEIDNPEGLDDFINRMIREFLAEHVKTAEVREARRQAGEAVDTTVRIHHCRD